MWIQLQSNDICKEILINALAFALHAPEDSWAFRHVPPDERANCMVKCFPLRQHKIPPSFHWEKMMGLALTSNSSPKQKSFKMESYFQHFQMCCSYLWSISITDNNSC